MSDLISRQAAIDAILKINDYNNSDRANALGLAEFAITTLPSAEPKRGRWIKLDMHRGMADHKCTACKQECYVPTCMGEPMYAFCPNCGAKMEVTE